MGDFGAPPGDGDALKGAATDLGTAETHLKADLTSSNKAVETALAHWTAPRADTFKTATFGIVTQLAFVADATGEVAVVVGQFATAWAGADDKIDGLRTRASTLRRKMEASDDPIEKISFQNQIDDLADDADEARRALKTLGDSLAASVDAQTDRLVPKGSGLSPDDLRRRVNGATGVTGVPPATPTDAWAQMAKAAVPGKLALDLAEDNKDGEKVGGPVTSLPIDPDILGAMRQAAQDAGIPPSRYAGLLHQYWVAKAADKAGIDLNGWDPSKGTDGNRSTISAVYTYYGSLFLKDPSKYQWAGMANMIGPSFAGGFLDIDMFKDLADKVSGPADAIPGWARGALPEPLRSLTTVANLGESELKWYETKFLAMQKHIFFDQASMHEAYDEGGASKGLDNIREMYQAGILDQRAMQAWTNIDTGIPSKVQDGNTDLLYREQNQVIDKQYDQMRDHDGPVGQAMTYMMTVVGSASIPGTKTPGEYSPLDFTIDSGDVPVVLNPVGPDVKVTVKTPLPDFNVSDKDSRWTYVTQDTLPAYQKLLAEDPERARQIVASNVDGRIADQRLSQRWPSVLKQYATDWDVDVDTGFHVGPFHFG